MGFSRQEYWSGLPCPPRGDLPDPGMEPASLMSPALAGGFFTTSAAWESPTHRYIFKGKFPLLMLSVIFTISLTQMTQSSLMDLIRSSVGGNAKEAIGIMKKKLILVPGLGTCEMPALFCALNLKPYLGLPRWLRW